MKIRTDKLLVSVYARHGDSCSLAPHCESLGCASGFKLDDYILAAKFAYLQEALDYILAITKHGLRARLISKIGPSAYISDYPKNLSVVKVPLTCPNVNLASEVSHSIVKEAL